MEKEQEDVIDMDEQQEPEIFTPYQNPTIAPNDAVRMLEACPVCGHKLHFTNFSDFSTLTTHEVSRCGDCGYRTQKSLNQLQ